MNTQNARDILHLAKTHRAYMATSAIPSCFCGSYNAKIRQQVMQLITGNKLPTAKCGINALAAALQAELGVENAGCSSLTEEAVNNALLTVAGVV